MKIWNLRSSIVAAALMVALSAATVFAGGAGARLRAAVDRGANNPSVAGKKVGGVDFVTVVVEGDAAKVASFIRTRGGQVRATIAGRYVTADIPTRLAMPLAARADVARVEAASRMEKHNDLGNYRDPLAAGPNADGEGYLGDGNDGTGSRTSLLFDATGETDGAGNGVVVAAIDSGVDVHHPDFRNPDGTTRILAYWDQSETGAQGGAAFAEYGYGREYTRAEINAALGVDAAGNVVGTPTAIAPDTDGHGTHVLGSIAGNGEATPGAPYAQYQFTGGAPKADIIFVKFDFEGERNSSASIIDGADWIFKRAESLASGAPCVVNMSLGSDFGPHDGSTAEERGLSALTGPGRIIATSAGNAGEIPGIRPTVGIHGSGTFGDRTGSDIVVDMNGALGAIGQNYFFCTAWYDGGSKCTVEITGPSGNTYSFRQWETNRGGAGYITADGVVSVYNGGDQLGWETNNGDNEIYVEFADYPEYPDNPLVTGEWTVRIIGSRRTKTTTYHNWHGFSPNFDGSTVTYDGQPSDSRMTIGSPATALGTISVGAYNTRGDGNGTENWNEWHSLTGAQSYGASFPVKLGELAWFSSRGPDRNGLTHPDITAPGVGIISSLSADAHGGFSDGAILAGGEHAVLQGTSMSCPITAGAIALALEVNPNLTPDDLRAAFAVTARADGFVNGFNDGSWWDTDNSPAPNDDWGPGKLDVPALLAAVDPGEVTLLSVTVSPGSANLTVGDSASFTATANYSDGSTDNVTALAQWSSSNSGVASVTAGDVTAVAAGSATITATFEGESDAASVAVTDVSQGGAPTVTGCSPDSAGRNQGLIVTVSGTGFQSGASVSFGNRINVQGVTFVSPTELRVQIKVHKRASTGSRDVTVTNPDGQSGTLVGGFAVN